MKNRKQPLFKSFGYAFEGIWDRDFKERNMKIHCLAVILVTAVGTFVGLTPIEWCICLLLFWNGDLTGTCEYGSGSCCRSSDRREKATC